MVTFRCNGNCCFCILNGRGKAPIPPELPGHEILDWWNGLDHPKGQRLSLIGGEPLFHKDILEIVAGLENYNLTITTNCTKPCYELTPHPTSTLRINTSYHPHLISADNYIKAIEGYQRAGHHVDQIAYVNYPGMEKKYAKQIKKVRRALGRLRRVPYLGFWNHVEGVNATPDPITIEPNEGYQDKEAAARICGLTDLDAYRDICGASVPRRVECIHPFKSLIIGPQGNHYHCHYKLYYDIDPVCNIKDFKPVEKDTPVIPYLSMVGSIQTKTCDYYGFCNWCDVPRVGCVKNPTAREIV
jgi:MoaA/NifB/PqqE/SkfB family radical SAM enzyme